MPQVNLTATYVRDLPLKVTGQTLIYDTRLPGFGLRVGIRKKAYFAEGRVGGRKQRVTLGSADQITLDTARKLWKKAMAEMADGTDRNAERRKAKAEAMTLREAVECYFADHDLKPNTEKENRRLIVADFSDWLDKDLKSITPTIVVARFDEISERRASVANHAFWVLRAVMNYARVVTKTDDGEFTLPPNPCQRLTDLNRWHKSNARTGRLSEDQFPAFFAALATADNETFADYMELLVRAGLRRNEAASLRWSDLNMTARTFTIPADNSKNGKALTLPMSRQIQRLFQRRRDAAPNSEKVFGDAKRFDPRKSLLALRKSISSDLTYHDCRRTFLTIAEQQAVPYGLLKKMGNHSAGNDVTMRHYANTVEHETLRPYMQAVSDAIDRLAGIADDALKLRDCADRLKQVCDELAGFQKFSEDLNQLNEIRAKLNSMAQHSML